MSWQAQCSLGGLESVARILSSLLSFRTRIQHTCPSPQKQPAAVSDVPHLDTQITAASSAECAVQRATGGRGAVRTLCQGEFSLVLREPEAVCHSGSILQGNVQRRPPTGSRQSNLWCAAQSRTTLRVQKSAVQPQILYLSLCTTILTESASFTAHIAPRCLGAPRRLGCPCCQPHSLISSYSAAAGLLSPSTPPEIFIKVSLATFSPM